MKIALDKLPTSIHERLIRDLSKSGLWDSVEHLRRTLRGLVIEVPAGSTFLSFDVRVPDDIIAKIKTGRLVSDHDAQALHKERDGNELN